MPDPSTVAASTHRACAVPWRSAGDLGVELSEAVTAAPVDHEIPGAVVQLRPPGRSWVHASTERATVTDGVFDFDVHVRPGGRRDAVEGVHDGVLAVRVAAPPTEGRANESVRRVVAAAFGVRPRSVELLAGASSRRKRLRVVGDPVALRQRHTELLAGGS